MARMNALADVVKGLKANIHAVDNLSPVAKVALYIRAGSRYEPDAVPGIAHYLRATAGITTQDSSYFGIARHVERLSSSFKVTNDREFIVYRIDCLRDRVGPVLKFVDDTINRPEFRSWELLDIVQPKLKHDLALSKKDQALVTNEALHKAAFRGGLAHSMLTPDYQVEKINNKQLFDFVEDNFVLERMSIVGTGISEQELREHIDGRFMFNDSNYKGVSGQSRYVGGESRVQANFPHTMVNFVVQGLPITDVKGLAALELVSTLLGDRQQKYVKYGDGSKTSLASVLNPISPALKSSVININYSDTGLFGFALCGPNEFMKEATKASIKHIRKVMSSLTEEELKKAKSATKARSLIHSEDNEKVFQAMGQRHAAGVVGQSPLDYIEKLTLKEVQEVTSSLLKKKPSIAAVGNPRYVPYIDEIDS